MLTGLQRVSIKSNVQYSQLNWVWSKEDKALPFRLELTYRAWEVSSIYNGSQALPYQRSISQDV